MTDNRFVNRSELIGILVLAAFLVVILPLCLDVFRLNLVAKYLTYAFVALGLVYLVLAATHRPTLRIRTLEFPIPPLGLAISYFREDARHCCTHFSSWLLIRLIRTRNVPMVTPSSDANSSLCSFVLPKRP